MTERAGLDAEQRTLLAGICVLAGAVSMVPSSYNFVLGPMLDGLSGSESQESLLRQLPSICALLVIFFLGGLARLLSVAMIGWPLPLFIVLGLIELILPPVFWWMHGRSFDRWRA